MKIFIWEGNGISGSYHDDGTLVLMAETVEQARELLRANKARYDKWQAENAERIQHYYQVTEKEWMAERGLRYSAELWQTSAGKELTKIRGSFDNPYCYCGWDGSDSALDREPDRVLDTNAPAIVAFNGGGYD